MVAKFEIFRPILSLLDEKICSECGQKCCREPFKQFYTAPEQQAVLTFLSESKIATIKKIENQVTCKNADGSCCFLDEKGLCEIYLHRSLDCAIYPFFYEFDATAKTITIYLDTTEICYPVLKNSPYLTDPIFIQKLSEEFAQELYLWTSAELLAYSALEPKTVGQISDQYRRITQFPFDPEMCKK